MPINVGDIIQIKAYCFFSSQLAINIYHYRISALGGAPTITQIGTAWDGSSAPLYKALLNDNAIYRGSTAQKIKPDIETLAITVANSGVGTGGATASPTQSCGIITKRSLMAGRSGRGRVYIPFPPAQAFTAATGLPTAGYLTALDTLAQDVFANPYTAFALPGFAMLPVIGQLSNTVIANWPEITAFTIQPKWGTQRRRGSYGRLNALPF